MKLASLALVSTSLVALLAAGCRKDDDDDTSLGSVDAQLIADDAETSETDDDLELGVDEPLSGATPEEPGNPADGATDDDVLEKARTNPGRFFQPAGCVRSTRDGNAITHVFSGCTGPWGLARFDGTITSTYAREPGKLTITHETSDFTANGATLEGTRAVVYTREGSLVTKTRTGNWTGTTAKGNAVRHQASFVSTYDAATRCVTRDGSAQTTLGGRSFERVVDGYERCGVGRGGCPTGGAITLRRTAGGDDASLRLEFLGGTRFQVTRPSGRPITRNLVCRADAS